VKNFTFAAALLLGTACAAQAAPLEIIEASSLAPQAQQSVPAPSSFAAVSAADLAVVRSTAVVAPPANMSELPEPEVFLMMLVGLCLIGYRASRHSDEKFE
jgi:hypothetical protein